MNYIVATIKPWNIAAFERRSPALTGKWHLVTDKDALTPELLATLKPRYIFFPHWSWIVPDWLLQNAECVCFHMTDVPYGRGGSPLQNLIERGHTETKLTALRMEKELDAGPVYLKKPLSLEGSAGKIFERMADLSYDMMAEIAEKEPQPVPQQGEPVIFKRRTPEMSRLPDKGDTKKIYDHIRMLDAQTYPRAFLRHGEFELDFSDAALEPDGSVSARVVIRKEKT